MSDITKAVVPEGKMFGSKETKYDVIIWPLPGYQCLLKKACIAELSPVEREM